MKLDLLLKREENFWLDLNNFVLSNYKALNAIGLVMSTNQDTYNYGRRLNFICSRLTKSSVVRLCIFDERYDRYKFLEFLRSVYIFFATTQILLKLSPNKKSLNFTLSEGIVIIPGNHSYRFYDTNCQKFYVFRKSIETKNFGQFQFSNQDYSKFSFLIRREHLVKSNTEIVIENYFDGKPLNRQQKYNPNDIIPLIELIENSVPFKFINSKTLLKELSHRIKNTLVLLDKKIDQKIIKLINKILTKIVDRVNIFEETEMQVCLSHGDFQPANILVNSNEIKVIDWEYADFRLLGFDRFTFAFETRSSNGFLNLDDKKKFFRIRTQFFCNV